MHDLSHHFRAQACNNAWSNLGLLRACAALDDAEIAAPPTVAIQRADHVQREPLVRVLAHLFQHQINHRGPRRPGREDESRPQQAANQYR